MQAHREDRGAAPNCACGICDRQLLPRHQREDLTISNPEALPRVPQPGIASLLTAIRRPAPFMLERGARLPLAAAGGMMASHYVARRTIQPRQRVAGQHIGLSPPRDTSGLFSPTPGWTHHATDGRPSSTGGAVRRPGPRSRRPTRARAVQPRRPTGELVARTWLASRSRSARRARSSTLA